MKEEQAGQSVGTVTAGRNGNGRASELDDLRATTKRQSHTLDKLYTAVSALHRGAAALKAENAELRAAATLAASTRAAGSANGAPRFRGLETRIALDERAPKAARDAVAGHVRHVVPAAILADAELVVSELMTNSVCHSGASAGQTATLRVELTASAVHLEVADSGRAGLVAPREADVEAGHGFGLNLVQALSRRWGVERIANTGTRVWAELAYTPLAAAAS